MHDRTAVLAVDGIGVMPVEAAAGDTSDLTRGRKMVWTMRRKRATPNDHE